MPQASQGPVSAASLSESFSPEEVAALRLSEREIQCLSLLAQGHQDSRIASQLGISRPTVRLHLVNARRKLKSATREQALARAVALGLIRP